MNEENLQVKPPQSSGNSAEASEAPNKKQRLEEMASSEVVRAKFWSKVKMGSADECWEWISTHDSYGYGLFYQPVQIVVKAHRFAWMIVNGPIPDGKERCMRHSCDNPGCVNPAHLSPGTLIDNRRDCVSRKRQATGAIFNRSSLTDADVMEIRRRHAQPKISKVIEMDTMAVEFGVSLSMIQKIVYRKNWKHL